MAALVEDTSGVVRKGSGPNIPEPISEPLEAPDPVMNTAPPPRGKPFRQRFEEAVEAQGGVQAATYWQINTGSGKYNYQYNRKDYTDPELAVHDALSLLSYDDDFRAYFYENEGKYLRRTGDMNYTVDDTIAYQDYLKMLNENPNWTPNPQYSQWLGDKKNYQLSLDELKSYYNQTLEVNLANANALAAQADANRKAEAAAALIKADEIKAEIAKSNQSLIDYLVSSFAAGGSSTGMKSWADFFQRVVPRTLQAAPFMGTMTQLYNELSTGKADPMGGFPFYTTSLQAQQMLAPFMYQSKSGKTMSWERPIYNIKNYYPQVKKIYKPKKRGYTVSG